MHTNVYMSKNTFYMMQGIKIHHSNSKTLAVIHESHKSIPVSSEKRICI